jgi:hypothetical protein
MLSPNWKNQAPLVVVWVLVAYFPLIVPAVIFGCIILWLLLSEIKLSLVGRVIVITGSDSGRPED